MRKILLWMGVLAICLLGCHNKSNQEIVSSEKTRIILFAAKSLNGVVEELSALYMKDHPDIEIISNYDSSGTLMEQIKEGASCDIFFPADTKQMDQLENDGLILDDTRANVVNNQVCLVTYKNSGSKVTGLGNIDEAESFALAAGSVPVGKYTRQAMVNSGILPLTEDVSLITTQQVSDALGGILINECINAGAVTAAVAEGANEIGTIYKSETYGLEDQLEVLEVIENDLTGDVIYPIAQTVNEEANEEENEVSQDFIQFLTSQQAWEVYEKYYFDPCVE